MAPKTPRPKYVSKKSIATGEWYVMDARNGKVAAYGFDSWSEAEDWIKAND